MSRISSVISDPRLAPEPAEEGELAPLVRRMLEALGEDPDREGLASTPKRVDQSLRFLTRGYSQSLTDIVNGAVFASDYQDIVLVRDIEIFSLCEHHLLPFFGKAHIAYLPDGKVLGLSKLPRIADIYARRLQVQENLTKQIADAVTEVIQPRGVAVILSCTHLCMAMRGVEKLGSTTMTKIFRGEFETEQRRREELFLALGAHHSSSSA